MFSKKFSDTVTVCQPGFAGFGSTDGVDYHLPFLFPRPGLQRVINSLKSGDRVRVIYKITSGDMEICMGGGFISVTLVGVTILR